MKVQELRLGNYLFIGGIERYVKVSAIFLSHFKCTDESGIDFNNHQNNIKPIKLTEEILLKCGFDLNSIPYHAIKGQVVLSLFRGVWAFKHVHTEVKYLHQLQNLYWCLTGKELNIEL